MEVQLLKIIITKLKTTDFFQALNRWSFLCPEDVEKIKSEWSRRQTKQVLSNHLAEICLKKQGFTMEKVGDLDLIYTQMYSVKRTWNAYHLTEKQGRSSAMPRNLAPETLKKELTRLLKLYFTTTCTVSVMLHNGLLWGRVYLPSPGQQRYQSNRCLYFIYYPETPVIIMNGMKAAFEVFLSQCLVLALGHKEITEMRLSGHDVESLAELALNKFSNGGYSKFQLTHRPTGPLGEVRSRKRKEPDITEHEKISCEYIQEKRQRLETLDNTFGTAVLPTLEKVEYRVELPYRGKGIAVELRNQPEVFNSRVRFHGKSVLEGIRNLGTNGFATVPLPKHLTCVPSRARNYFLLAKKQTASQPQDTTGRSAVSIEQNKTTRLSSPVRVPNRTATPSEQNRTGQVTRSHTSHSSPVRVPSRTATPNEQNRTGQVKKSFMQQRRTTSHSSPERVPNRTARDVTTPRGQNRTARGSISQTEHNRTVTHSSPGKVNKRTGRESVSLNENSRAKPSLPLRERNQIEVSGSDSVKKQDRKVGGSVSLNVQKGKQSGETSRKEKNVKSNTKLSVKKVLAVNNSQNFTKSGNKRYEL